jgi:hypothetical protein
MTPPMVKRRPGVPPPSVPAGMPARAFVRSVNSLLHAHGSGPQPQQLIRGGRASTHDASTVPLPLLCSPSSAVLSHHLFLAGRELDDNACAAGAATGLALPRPPPSLPLPALCVPPPRTCRATSTHAFGLSCSISFLIIRPSCFIWFWPIAIFRSDGC